MKVNTMTLRRFLTVFFVTFCTLLAGANPAQSEIFDFHLEPRASECVGKVETIDGSFDSVTEVMTFNVNFSAIPNNCDDDSSGQLTLPDGYMLVINNGPFPAGAQDVAVFYFDGLNQANPKLTVYGYCGNPTSCWQTASLEQANVGPDKILSSISTPSFVQNLVVRNEANGTRTFQFSADMTDIIDHTPLAPSGPQVPWYGAGFDELVGIWFFPVAGLSASYGADGFLTNWRYGAEGWWDLTNFPTGVGPECRAQVYVDPMEVRVGESISVIVGGYHPQYDRLTFSFPTLAPGATTTIASGSTWRAPYGFEVEWSATEADLGKSYDFEVKVTDTAGRSANCGFRVRVPTQEEQDCPTEIDRCGVCGGDGNSCLNCDEVDYTETLVTLDQGAKKQEQLIQHAARALKKISGTSATKKYVSAVLKLAHDLQIRNWTITWQYPQVIRTCGNTLFCVSYDHSSIIEEYRTHSEELRQLMYQVIAKTIKARGGPATKKDKQYRKWADNQHRLNMELADTVPVTTSDCA